MNNFFLPTSRKGLPTFQTFCPDGGHWGPFCPGSSSFCPFSKSGQEKGLFGVGLGVVCVCAYPEKVGKSAVKLGIKNIIIIVWLMS